MHACSSAAAARAFACTGARLPLLPRLEALPDALGELPSLLRLNVSTNALRALPASMGKLRKVQRINAANNMLVRAQHPRRSQLHAAARAHAVCGRRAACGQLVALHHGSTCASARRRSACRPSRPQRMPSDSHPLCAWQVRVPPSMGHLKTIKELNLRCALWQRSASNSE